MDDLRLTEFDQILVCGPRVKAADIQVGFAQLLPPTAAAAVADGVAVAVVVGAWWSHLMVGGGHIRLLQEIKRGCGQSQDSCTVNSNSFLILH